MIRQKIGTRLYIQFINDEHIDTVVSVVVQLNAFCKYIHFVFLHVLSSFIFIFSELKVDTVQSFAIKTSQSVLYCLCTQFTVL